MKKEQCDTCKAVMPLEYMVQKYNDIKEVCECKDCKNTRISYSGEDPLFMMIGETLPTIRQQTKIERLFKWALG